MSIYVDQMFQTQKSRRWPFFQACHMVADTEEELDAMALRIGLRPSWKQVQKGRPSHYDLTTGKRDQALRLGAIRDCALRTFFDNWYAARNKERTDED